MDLDYLKSKIRDVNDFPTPGVVFRDITPVLDDADAFSAAVGAFAEQFRDEGIEKVVGIESRGFMFSAPVAYLLDAGAVMARKHGKLPYKTVSIKHKLEYGEGALEMHEDSIRPGERVIILDDVFATSGTMGAAIQLVEQLRGDIVGLGVLLELLRFNGREKLGKYELFSLLAL